MAAQYSSNAQGLQPFDIDQVTITRRAGSVGSISVTSVYSGVADLQELAASTVYNPSGAVEDADAILIIDIAPLPTVNVGDVVTRASDGKVWIVKGVGMFPFALPHLQCELKRGPLGYQQV